MLKMGYDFETLRGDLFGGITSTIVALPVALGFGVASGLGAAAGLYGAIAVGFFASVFGGTRSQISGPSGPMTVAMAVIVASHAATLSEALTVVVMAGLLQVLLGLSGVGRFVAYTPYVVVSGFMSGIGIILFLLQAMPFLGAPTAPGGPMGAAAALPEAVAGVNADAFVIGAVTLAVAIGLIAAGMSHARRIERMELDSVVSVPILDRTFFGRAEGEAGGEGAPRDETAGAEEPEAEVPGAHDPWSARVGLVALKGSFTVASSHKLVSVIGADIKEHEVTIFDFSGATHIDDSAAMVIEQLIGVAGRQETEVIVMGAAGRVADALHTLDVLRNVPEGHEVESLDEAREVARNLLRD